MKRVLAPVALFLPAVLAVFFLPNAGWNKQFFLFFFLVPHDFEFEVAREYPDTRFWLASEQGFEPLPVGPGQSYRVDGDRRWGSHRFAEVVAAPPGRVEELIGQLGPRKTWDEIYSGRPPVGVLRSKPIDFNAIVPIYDTRDGVVDRYELLVCPPDRVGLEFVEQNRGANWVKAAWFVAAAAALAGAVWLGGLVIWGVWRQARRAWAYPSSTVVADRNPSANNPRSGSHPPAGI